VTGLLLVLLVVGVTLTVVLWAGTVYLQSYFYTEASTDVFWQAPAAAAALTLFFTVWCLLDANAEGAGPKNLPYNTILEFSAQETKGKKPVEHLVAERKNQKPVKLKRRTIGQDKYVYEVERDKQPDPKSPWRSLGVVDAIVIEQDGVTSRFLPQPSERGQYQRFVDSEGWTMMVYDDGPTGQPTIFSTGRFLVNSFLNLLHYVLWVVCLWLLLRFQLSHALGLGLVLWLIMTVAILPMLLMQAGAVAQDSATSQKAAVHTPPESVATSRARPR
jgi:hypothetical protein